MYICIELINTYDMETNKWIDFVIAFTAKLHEHDYNGAIDMAFNIDFENLTDDQAVWLEDCITKVRDRHNI